MIKNFLTAALLSCLWLSCCGSGESGGKGTAPAVRLTLVSVGASTVSIEAVRINSTHIKLIYLPAQVQAPDPAELGMSETSYMDSSITIGGLDYSTDYTLYAVACDDTGRYGNLEQVSFTTENADAEMYPWERERGGILSFTDLVLCYGGSRHRSPYLWTAERYAPHVVYTDENGEGHWLFDSFLCLEYTSASRADGEHYSYAVGHYGTSAGKMIWQEQLDYWFRDDSGLKCLDRAIESAAAQLGDPPFRHKVVMSIPDPIIYRTWDDPASTTRYWGSLDDGRELDFSVPEDRIAAQKWFINQVRRQFDQARFSHIELAGFYYISEELVSPDDGWNYELKRSDELIPAVAAYLHSLNQSLSWIPYNRSAGYTRRQAFGLDYVYMQPNYFWDTDGTKPLSRFFADIAAHGLDMELEFDTELLDGYLGADSYRQRLREYMEGAKNHGVYGTKRFAYYIGNDCLYDLYASHSAKDRQIFHEFCRFVIGNPLRTY